MPSPFPGVDPYIESTGYWLDFHITFVVTLADTLNEVLPRRYDARINERPCPLLCDDEGVHEYPGRMARFLEIRILRERDPLTVISLLFEEDNTESGLRLYAEWVQECRAASRAVVEIDLLHKGLRSIPGIPRPGCDYYLLVTRPDGVFKAQSWSVREPIPSLSLPLAPPDDDVVVDLGAIYTATYDRARYRRALNYAVMADTLDEADRDWARHLTLAMQPSTPPPT